MARKSSKLFVVQPRSLADIQAETAAKAAAKEIAKLARGPRYGEHLWPAGMRFEDAKTTDATGPVRMSGGASLMEFRSVTGGSFR